eukprot:5440042-Prymnesium_polylepis.1
MARASQYEPTGERLFLGMKKDGMGGGGVHHSGVVQHCVDIAHGAWLASGSAGHQPHEGAGCRSCLRAPTARR